MLRGRLAPNAPPATKGDMMNEGKSQTQEDRRVIGLDMHPDTFTAAALSGRTALDVEIHWVHDHLPQEKLERWVQRHVLPTDLIVIEASGNTFNTVDRIHNCGGQAVVLEALRASKVRKAYCSTDKISAVKLARVYLSGLAHEVWTPDEKTRERREVFQAHKRAVQDSTRGRNRIRSWMTGFGIRRRRGLRLTHDSGREWVMAQREWSITQRLLLDQMFDDLWQAENRRRRLRQVMAEAVTSNAQLLKLLRLFGIRNIGAYALWAMIGDIHRFRTPKKLVAYLGLTPTINRSGNSKKDGPMVTWGSGEMRRILTQAAQTILRYEHGSPLQNWGLKLLYRRGRALAVVAVARKLVVAVWYLLKGFFTPMLEPTQTLKTKLLEIAKEIGRDRLHEMGYRNSVEFRDQKIKILLNTT